jgi:hypothetical protein
MLVGVPTVFSYFWSLPLPDYSSDISYWIYLTPSYSTFLRYYFCLDYVSAVVNRRCSILLSSLTSRNSFPTTSYGNPTEALWFTTIWSPSWPHDSGLWSYPTFSPTVSCDFLHLILLRIHVNAYFWELVCCAHVILFSDRGCTTSDILFPDHSLASRAAALFWYYWPSRLLSPRLLDFIRYLSFTNFVSPCHTSPLILVLS